MQFHFNDAAPADNDIPLELRINADDDGGTETTLSTVRWYQRDVTAATDDAEFYMSLMVDGTERQVLQIDTDSVEIGNGNAAAVLSSSGAFDLTLETNRGTNSGTITIVDGVDGNIQIAPDGIGILDLNSGFDIDAASTETCTITVVGTTGDGLYIDSSTITSGDVVAIDHTVSGTLNGGNLLNLLVDSVSVFRVGETGNVTVVGSAGTNVVTVSNGDLVVSDGSLTMTDADDAATVSATNNTATTASVFVFAGSGAFTGTTTTSFMTLTPSGLTTGTALYLNATAASTSVGVVDIITDSLTSGTTLRITESTAAFTTGGRAIEVTLVAATAGNGITVDTTGAYTGTGLITATAGAMTTGVVVSLTSTTGLTSGSLLRATTSTAGALATNGAYSLRGTGAHTSTSNTGLLDVRSSGMVGTAANSTLVNFMATGAAQVDTTLLNVEASGFTTGYTGTMVRITSPTTTGSGTLVGVIADGITSGGTAMDISADALTTGLGLNIANTGGAMTTGSLLRVTVAGTGAVATNGIVSFTHTGDFTSTSATNGGFVEIKANDTLAGVVFNLVADALTTGVGMHISNGTAATTSGSLLRVTAGGVGAVATNGVVSFVHTGVYTSTTIGFLNVSASGTTGGTVATITGAAVTDGVGLQVSNASITTGAHFRVLGAAGATMFNVGVNGATTITGSAGLTAALTLTSGDLVMSAGVFRGATHAAVTADVGSVQGGSPITRSFVEISVSANAGDAVTLPAAAVGQFVIITNHGANAADVFPASGDAINEGAADAAVSIAVNETFLCWAYDGTNWEVTQLARNS